MEVIRSHFLRLLVACASVFLSAASALAQTEDSRTLPTVTIATVDEREILAVVPVSGTVRPMEEVYITPQLNGVQVRQVLVDVGDWVNAGDTLIKLRRDLHESHLSQANAETARARSSIRQAQNQIASTEASVAQAEAELVRMQRLFESGSIAQAAYDEVLARTEAARAAAASAQDGLAIAEATEEQAKAQLDIAELNLKWTEITSPVTGVVGGRDAKVGSLTAMGGPPLLTIFQGGALELSADVIETALGDVESGDGGSVEVAGVGPLIASVRMVSPTVDDVTRLGEVRITLENHKNLRAGLFGRGDIVTERRTALAVPITAVLSDDDGFYVQIVDDGVISRHAVVPGLVWQSMREIASGLSGGETVVARAGAFFRTGDKVRVVEVSSETGQ